MICAVPHRSRLLAAALAGSLASLIAAQGAAWELPPEGRCPDFTGAPADDLAEDIGAPMVQEGGMVGLEQMMALHQLLPPEVWSYREAFFYEGMRMEIGSCHRRYPVAAFYAAATDEFQGRARVDEDGNLHDYLAGLPFPPASFAASTPGAAARWAWNLQHRYVGAGPVGSFRIVDMPARLGTPQTFEGTFFYVRTGHRADLAVSDYRVPESKKSVFVAGGKFERPLAARHLAWRQIRLRDSERNYRKADDTFVYVPTMRKPRRAASTWVDGLYTPRYTVSGDDGGGPIPIGVGGSEFAPALDSIQPTAGLSIAATEDIRRGFTGLALRPNAYDWKLVGEREVLAPLNAVAPGWPLVENRNYGPSGLSVASDRWDVRHAVVIEGTARRRVEGVAAVVLWIDIQTQQPLYMITKRDNGLLLDVGILVHRFSGDEAAYATWPGGEPAHVFDPVAAVFYFVPGGGSGWRRESYDVRSLPVDPARLRKMTSTDELVKGR
jgi:hypothetical protein